MSNAWTTCKANQQKVRIWFAVTVSVSLAVTSLFAWIEPQTFPLLCTTFTLLIVVLGTVLVRARVRYNDHQIQYRYFRTIKRPWQDAVGWSYSSVAGRQFVSYSEAMFNIIWVSWSSVCFSVGEKMRITLSILVLMLCSLTSQLVLADTVDFEDVVPIKTPATPFVSGGLEFSSNTIGNLVLPPGFAFGADNGTQTFAWCGTSCGGLQTISATTTTGKLFDLLSIDAANLASAEFFNGWVPGMTVELVGFQAGGNVVTQSLLIQEDVFTTYSLVGFSNLTGFDIFSPIVFSDAGVDFPDPHIDNIVFQAVPEPATFVMLSISTLALVRRLR